MMFQRALLIASLILAVGIVDASPPPVARPLQIVAKAATGIAILTVGSAVVDFESRSARYEIEVNEVLRGSLAQNCLTGPMGLKVGRRYVVFLDSVATEQHCGSLRIAGVTDPAAFEVDTLRAQGDFVRLDHRRIIAPEFDDSVEVKQVLEAGGERSETVLGTIVPLKTFLKYVNR